VIIAPVRYALDYYRRLNEASQMLKRRSTDTQQSQTHRGSTVSSSQPNSLCCDHLPSDGAGGRRTRDNSLSTSTEPSRPSSTLPHHHRGSAVSLPPPRASIPRLTSFPSMDSPQSEPDSELEEAMTEVSVSERALKFKIATESSMELTTVSRKGSRENESSDQSGAHVQFAKDESSGGITLEGGDLKPAEELSDPQLKVKGKDSLFRRFKLFTEKLSSPKTEKESWSGASGGGPPTSPPESQPSNSTHSPRLGLASQGLSYFRRSPTEKPVKERPRSSDSKSPSILSPRRGSRRGSRLGSESEGGEGSSGDGKREVCSGSLDSILSKEEGKSSPVRRLLLPRFSSFVSKRTARMGLLIKRSPKRMTSPTPEKEDDLS